MIQNKVYGDMGLWFEVFEAIGGDIKQLHEVHRKTLESSSGLKFELYYNKGRESRPDSSGEDNPNNCSSSFVNGMEKERRRILFGDKKNLVYARSYNGYWVVPNLYPINKGHMVLVQENAHKNRVRRRDLEGVLELVFDRGLVILHNMEKAASTFHEEDHFQAMPGQFHIDFMELEEAGEDRYKIKSYPGEHAVFTGYNCTLNAERVIKNLDVKDIPHTIICSKGDDGNERIYIFPIKVPQYKGGNGGFEAGLNAVTNNMIEYDKLNNANKFESKLRNIYYKHEAEELSGIYEEKRIVIGV